MKNLAWPKKQKCDKLAEINQWQTAQSASLCPEEGASFKMRVSKIWHSKIWHSQKGPLFGTSHVKGRVSTLPSPKNTSPCIDVSLSQPLLAKKAPSDEAIKVFFLSPKAKTSAVGKGGGGKNGKNSHGWNNEKKPLLVTLFFGGGGGSSLSKNL